MGIRFSMKWLLAGMVYVAVAAAAFTQIKWGWADGLWVISHLAICYAAGLSIYGAGVRRARALGFLMGSLAFVITLEVSPDRVPAGRIARALAPDPRVIRVTQPSGAVVYVSQPVDPEFHVVQARTANAVGVLLAGAAGSLVTALAFRQCQPPPRES